MTDNDLLARAEDTRRRSIHNPYALIDELAAALRARDTELAAARTLIAAMLMTVDDFGLDADTLSIHVDNMRVWLAGTTEPAEDDE